MAALDNHGSTVTITPAYVGKFVTNFEPFAGIIVDCTRSTVSTTNIAHDQTMHADLQVSTPRLPLQQDVAVSGVKMVQWFGRRRYLVMAILSRHKPREKPHQTSQQCSNRTLFSL